MTRAVLNFVGVCALAVATLPALASASCPEGDKKPVNGLACPGGDQKTPAPTPAPKPGA